MGELSWPGDVRAGDHGSDAAYLRAMVRVELAWLAALGVRPPPPPDLTPADLPVTEGGTPVTVLVPVLRERLDGDAARWLHRGLTSQDVVDTALMLVARDAVDAVRDALRTQVATLVGLAGAHRDSSMVARTLTQHAVPGTFGLKVATWLAGLLDVDDDLAGLRFPVQAGGAAGTSAALVELGRDPGEARVALAGRLGLDESLPWHTNRRPVTRIADALVACTDGWARIANDVLVLGRPEIAELAEGAGGGSSTMPHKSNPVLSVLLRRAALTTPQLAATLHLAAADQVDERAAGGWHAEWDTLLVLLRRTVVAAAQASDLVAGLQVHPDRMAANLAAAAGVVSEQQSMADLVGAPPKDGYLGEAGALVDAVLARARGHLDSDR